MSTASSLSSATGGAPTLPTNAVLCQPQSAPNLRNLTGLEGQLCQVNWSPSIIDITGCCGNNTIPRVQDNCTQYCVYNGRVRVFSDCVRDLLNDSADKDRTFPYCFVLGPDGSQMNTTDDDNDGTATNSPSATSPTNAAETQNAAADTVRTSFATLFMISLTCGGLFLGAGFML